MSEWECRSCNGGFPKPIKHNGLWKCPWCSAPIAKYAREYGTREIGNMVKE